MDFRRTRSRVTSARNGSGCAVSPWDELIRTKLAAGDADALRRTLVAPRPTQAAPAKMIKVTYCGVGTSEVTPAFKYNFCLHAKAFVQRSGSLEIPDCFIELAEFPSAVA